MDKALFNGEPWSQTPEHVLAALDVEPQQGLRDAGAVKRRAVYGENALRQVETRHWTSILVAQLKSLIVLLLLIGAGLSFAFSHIVEGFSILAVIVLNTCIGFVTELKAVRSMEALRQLGSVAAVVRRAGQRKKIPAKDLVPGDIVILEAGDIITADLRLIEGSRLEVNEAPLTGESVPVEKDIQPVDANALLAERSCILYKGTAVTRGAGEAVVIATGMNTELGRITSLVEEADDGDTPLEQRLDQLGQRLAWASLAFVALVAISGIITGRDVYFVLETAIALAVATVPEGLPIVATLALARGMWRMARRNALVDKLSAVETLGSTGVILTDKTGTLTENQMTASLLVLPSGEVNVEGVGLETEGRFLREGQEIDEATQKQVDTLLKTALLCTDTALQVSNDDRVTGYVGDPMEAALLIGGRKAGWKRREVKEEWPEVRAEAFDPELKMMATYHQRDDVIVLAVKGAPEAVLARCVKDTSQPLTEETHAAWLAKSERYAESGFRMLAIATRRVESVDEEEPYRDLTLLGLVGLIDPPRKTVSAAINACKKAGIRVVMATGDHPATARYVGRALGLINPNDSQQALTAEGLTEPSALSAEARQIYSQASIVTRMSPEQKLNLIDLHQSTGAVVAMLGDGVNDAPALKKSNIGIAMGKRGTQVAKETADIVLLDDELGTVVAAIEQGRIIFNNIRKFVVYLISCNLSEILAVGLASLVGAPLPILPLQILFLNLVTDVFPALALAASEGDPAIMKQPPKHPEESLMTRNHWMHVAAYGFLLASTVLGSYAFAHYILHYNGTQAVTVSFLTLAFAQIVHVFNIVEPGAGLFRNEVSKNMWVWGAVLLCTVLLLGALYIPLLARVLGVTPLNATGWFTVLGFSAVPLVVGLMYRAIRNLAASSSELQISI